MNFVPLQIAGGAAYFEGIAMVAVALAMLLRFDKTAARAAARILLLVGIAAVAASSTPLPLWLELEWFTLAVVCMVFFRPPAPRARNISLAAVFVVFSAALCICEARHRILPRIHVARDQPVYVIGDSISAGIGGRDEKPWPLVLAGETHLNIVNLARPGATLATARGQVAGVRSPHALVILEIGGNDMLDGVKPAYFREQLAAILSKLQAGGDSIVMLELPLLPFNNGIGAAQRSLAAQYHATLVPKRCMASVIGRKGGTVDSLHFSQQGHDAFAQIMKSMLVIDPAKP